MEPELGDESGLEAEIKKHRRKSGDEVDLDNMALKSLKYTIKERAREQADGLDMDNMNMGDLEFLMKKDEVRRYQDDTKNRKKLSLWMVSVVSIYLIYIFVLLPLNPAHVHLSDIVLVALSGTTTLNILGLMYIVLKGHFKVQP